MAKSKEVQEIFTNIYEQLSILEHVHDADEYQVETARLAIEKLSCQIK